MWRWSQSERTAYETPIHKHVWTKRRSLARIAGELKINRTIQLDFVAKLRCTHPQKLNKLNFCYLEQPKDYIQSSKNVEYCSISCIHLNIRSFWNCYFMKAICQDSGGKKRTISSDSQGYSTLWPYFHFMLKMNQLYSTGWPTTSTIS